MSVDVVVPDASFFATMPPDVRAVVVASLQPVSFSFGEAVTREGDEADALFVLTAGRARVLKAGTGGQEVPLNVLGPGAVFGEVALLSGGGRRSATVRASGALETLRLDRAVFDALLKARSDVREWATREAERHALRDFVRLHTPFAALGGEDLAGLLDAIEPREVAPGESVAGPGIVGDGRLRVVADGRTVALRRRGDVLGADETAEALTEGRLLVVPAGALEQAVAAVPGLRERLAERSARGVTHVPLDFAGEVVVEPSAIVAAAGEPHVADDEVGEGDPGADERFARPRRRIRRFPLVWQVDEMDCGAACLAMAARHFGTRVSLPWLREVVGTGRDGTSLRGLVDGAERVGMAARALKASPSRLDELSLPAVCHWEGNHWVVLYDTAPGAVRVADPARGLRRIGRDEWLRQWSGYCCLLAPTPALAGAPGPRPAWRWLAPYFRPYRRALAAAAVLALLAAALEMLIPVFAGRIVDRAVAHHDHAQLHLLAAAMIGVLVAAVGATLVQRRLLARMAVRFDAETLDHVTRRLFSLPLAYFGTRRTGDLERRLAGMRQIRTYVVQEGVVALAAGAQVLVAVVIMAAYSLVLAAVFLATVPLYALAMLYARARLRPLLASLEDAFGRYASRQIDALKGIETVKAHGAEEPLARLMRRQFDELADRVFRADRAFMTYDAAVQLVTFLTLALVLWAGGLLVLSGDLSLGGLVAFEGLAVLAGAPLAVLLHTWDDLQHASVLLGRVDDVLAQEPEQGADHAALRPVPTLGGLVEVRALRVLAPGRRVVPILDGIDLEAEPGTTVAIVGRSGAGKTTLARCLAGLVEPASGQVLYDGVPLAELELRDLRRRIGFVLQDVHLFDDTIAANIALGDEAPDLERVRWAARLADAAEFVERLPLGYETRVGDSGLGLAGGQAQRVAIARALYRRPPVLILDEATAALDTEAERSVKTGIAELLDGCTAFVIAHRLSTIRDADLIVVLERGRIAEQGTHAELMANEGLYRYLVSQQLES